MGHNNRLEYPEPIWKEDVTLPTFPTLDGDVNVDVTIIGAGITGVTTAYLLSQEGLNVALLDAGTVLNGTTSHTTAKVTIQHGLIYDELIQHVGLEKTKEYVKANEHAMKWMEQWISEKQVDCGWTNEDAFVYTNEHAKLDALKKELKAYEKLQINGGFLTTMPLQIDHLGALVIRNQGQFHPLKYLLAMIHELRQSGAHINENTVAVNIEEGQKVKVKTKDNQTIVSDHVVIASHFPMYWKGLYFARMYAERAYVVAAKMKEPYPGGMYISAEEPKRSLRKTTYNGEEVVLITGENHKTGQGIDTMQHYHNLEAFAEKTFQIENYVTRWSTQDLITTDKLPYIGRATKNLKNIYVATGFHKWGMTNGTAAAHLIKDLILQKENPYAEVVTPTRFHSDPDFKQLFIQNFDVAKYFVTGKMSLPTKKTSDLQKDEGAVVQLGGERKGAYKCPKGEIHIVDTTCTHLGCELAWNSGDRTWDCPCHGSRFSYKGQVVEGPAERPLHYEHFTGE
ncbi:FAD-dependent oxidoreductase [Bacillus sp. FJAT-47783]|uniref:FAD-dependent oxidoreductase n=1 Tax=Bacillus sp. FJAT-47783 TaxID=2922712 RepID=UPI001FADD3B9|nr:FAD-dependent oxidoreductase [Bacillus sp. FJAT-47783]